MPGFNNNVMNAQGSDVGVFPNTTSSDNSTEFSRSGSAVTSIVNNTSDTADSEAQHTIRVEGGSAGDPWLQTSVGTTKSYAIGQDNSDGDFLKITTASSGTIDPSSGTPLLVFDEGVVGNFRAQFPIDRLVLSDSVAGADVDLNIQNSNTAANSDARINIQTSATSGGNGYITWTGPVNNWFTGVDKGNSNRFEISTGLTGGFPATTSVMFATIDGEVTFPNTPSFLAQTDPATSQNNVTGAGTIYTVLYPTEVYDVNSDYSSPNFTAPVTGKYFFFANVRLNNLDALATSGIFGIVTSNRNYNSLSANMGAMRTSANGLTLLTTCVADMDAADTASVRVQAANMAGDTVDIGVTSTDDSRFGGFLLG